MRDARLCSCSIEAVQRACQSSDEAGALGEVGRDDELVLARRPFATPLEPSCRCVPTRASDYWTQLTPVLAPAGPMSPAPSSPSSSASRLEAILQRPPPLDLAPADFSEVTQALTTDGKPRALALATLARFLSPAPTSTTRTSLQHALQSLLAGTDSRELAQGLSTLSAVLQVAPPLAADLLKDDSLRSHLEDAVELISQPPTRSTAPTAAARGERLALVELLSLAAGQAGMRALVRRSAGPWLEGLLGALGGPVGGEDAREKALAAVAVVKLRLGKDEVAATGLPASEPDAEQPPSRWTLEELARLAAKLVPLGMRGSEPDDEVLLPALEALAYLTLFPSPAIKATATSTALLTPLLSLAPKQPTTPPASSSARDYALATFLDHLTAFPTPDAEGEAAQLERLKRFAAAAAAKGAAKLEPESVESVTKRVALLVRHDPSPIPTVRQLCLSPSLQTRRLAARILHALVTPQPVRGALLQAGAARLFLTLIRQLPTPFSPADDTPAPQGLAKLLITANPLLVLGPTPDSPLLLEAAAALALPLGAPAAAPASTAGGADLLPRFEALMALTNLASVGPTLADNLARLALRDRPTGTSLLAVVADEYLLSTHTMVRRAAAELVCNVVASDSGIAFFEPAAASVSASASAGEGPAPAAAGESASTSTSRLQVLVALASSPDTLTRLAAAGALTSLVYAPSIVAALVARPKWVELLVAPLEDDEAGVRHRVYEVWRVVGEAVRPMEGEARERAREGMRSGRVAQRLGEARAREQVLELREVVEAAVAAVGEA